MKKEGRGSYFEKREYYEYKRVARGSIGALAVDVCCDLHRLGLP